MNDATIPAVAATIPALLFSAARHHAARAALQGADGAWKPERRRAGGDPGHRAPPGATRA